MSHPASRPGSRARGTRTAALAFPILIAPLGLRAQTGPVAGSPPGRPALAGTAGTRIDLDSVDLAGVTTLSELLQARAPGLLVQATSGLAGSGARLASRGRRSAYAADEPLLVVDGMRVVGGRRVAQVDSTLATSRYDDLPVEQIAAVEVLAGPAAAARYGPGAAAGAVVVTTRRAQPGRAERRLYADAGTDEAAGRRPALYQGVGRFADGERVGCTLSAQAADACTLVRVTTVRPYDAAGLRTGARARAGGRFSGGDARARYLVGVDAARVGGPLAGNDVSRGTLRATADLQPARALRVALGATALAQSTSAPLGGLESGVDLAVNQNIAFGWFTNAAANLSTSRLDASGTATWAAQPWLDLRAAVATSHARQRERAHQETPPTSSGYQFFQDRTGTSRDRVTVAEVGATAAYRAAGATLTTDLLVQHIDDRVRLTGAETGRTVDPSRGLELSAESSHEGWRSSDLRGLVLGQRLAAGRLSAGGTLRYDRLGDAGVHATTGAADAAYRVWARGPRAVDVRAAYGTAVAGPPVGLPLLLVAVPAQNYYYFDGTSPDAVQGPTLPAFERTREREVGLDAQLGPAVRARLTVYDQRTRDALVPVGIYNPYTGGGTGLLTVGLRNTGLEASVETRLVERPGLDATLGVRAWGGRNRVQSPGTLQGLVQGVTGVYQLVRDGAPLGAFAGAPGRPRARDYDGDGIVTDAEAARAAQEALGASQGTDWRVLGSATPTRTLAADLRAHVRRRLTVAALAEYQGGRWAPGDVAALFNAARGTVDPAAPLDAQARAASAHVIPESQLERADFLRLRELSVGWRLGGAAGAGRGGAGRGTTVTLAGRNLLTATRYTGLDPEGETNPGAALPTPGASAYYAVPVARTVALRVTAGW